MLASNKASISVGPCAAYLTLRTWKGRPDASSPKAMNRLDAEEEEVEDVYPYVQPHKPKRNQVSDAGRIDASERTSLGGDLKLNGESELGRLMSVQKTINEAPEEAEIGTEIFESKANSHFGLGGREDQIATMSQKPKNEEEKRPETVVFDACEMKEVVVRPQTEEAQNNYQVASVGDEEGKGGNQEDEFDLQSVDDVI